MEAAAGPSTDAKTGTSTPCSTAEEESSTGQGSPSGSGSGTSQSNSEEAGPLPPAEPLFQTALRYVTAQGATEVDAKLALDAAAAHKSDVAEWAEQALLWLAMYREQQAEAANLGQAMAVSLQEAEQRKECVLRLEDQTDEEVGETFKGSAVLAQLQASKCKDQLLAEPLRKPLLRLLELERNCNKWYPGPGTRAYCKLLAEECAALVKASCSAATPEQANGRASPSASACQAPQTKRRRTRNSKEMPSAAGAPTSPAPHHASVAAAVQALLPCIQRKVKEIEVNIFAMPAECGQIPSLFQIAGAEEQQLEESDIEITLVKTSADKATGRGSIQLEP